MSNLIITISRTYGSGGRVINMSEYSPEKAVKAIIGYSEIFRKL